MVDAAPVADAGDRSAFSWENSPRKVATWLQPPPAPAGARPEWNGSTLVRAATFDDLRSQYRWRKQIEELGGTAGARPRESAEGGADQEDGEVDDSYLDDPEFLRYAREQHAEVCSCDSGL